MCNSKIHPREEEEERPQHASASLYLLVVLAVVVLIILCICAPIKISAYRRRSYKRLQQEPSPDKPPSHTISEVRNRREVRLPPQRQYPTKTVPFDHNFKPAHEINAPNPPTTSFGKGTYVPSNQRKPITVSRKVSFPQLSKSSGLKFPTLPEPLTPTIVESKPIPNTSQEILESLAPESRTKLETVLSEVTEIEKAEVTKEITTLREENKLPSSESLTEFWDDISDSGGSLEEDPQNIEDVFWVRKFRESLKSNPPQDQELFEMEKLSSDLEFLNLDETKSGGTEGNQSVKPSQEILAKPTDTSEFVQRSGEQRKSNPW